MRIRKGRLFGTLNGGIGAADTALSITPDVNSSALPLVGGLSIMVLILEPDTAQEEIVWITSCATAAVSGITVLRGQEGTAAIPHATGVVYKHGPTLYDYVSINDRAWHRDSPNVNDDEFNGGVLDPAWVTTISSGSASFVVGSDSLSVKVSGQAGSSAVSILKPLNGFSIGNTIETAVRRMWIDSYIMAGPFLANGTSTGSNALFQMPYSNQLSTRYGTIGSISADFGSFTAAGIAASGALLYERMTWVAANTFQTSWSTDGVQWTSFGHGPYTWNVTPTYMGFGTTTWGGGNEALASYEYFRVI